jgi:predicted metalloprotease with PDZ domain
LLGYHGAMRALAPALFLIAALLSGAATAQPRGAPQPAAAHAPIPAPRDVAYPGVMRVLVDATDLDRRIYRVRQTIPVSRPGRMTLLYPRWLPGNHAPSGPLHNFAGLTITAGGKPLAWTRDPLEVAAFHITVPAGVREIGIEAQFLSPTEAAQGSTMMTQEMLRLPWHFMTLYPAGYFTRRITVEASARLPAGWSHATALETASTANGVVTFKLVSFEVLADSPVMAGKYFKAFDLDPGGRSRVTLAVVADAPEYLEASPEVIEIHRALVRQMDRLYGARHFDHYDFLFSLSERLSGIGLEHQRSSENGVGAKYFTTWKSSFISRDLLAHEYNHSWNGKYRRPADLWTPNFNTPMRDSLLWVYEGQDQYYGNVVAARAGFLTKAQALESLAEVAATYEMRVGRAWRPLQDTTNDPIIAARRAIPWTSWQRSEDYYREGQLIWLDVDTLIRERSKGARSLDDFARAFFGVNDGDWGQLTYDFEEVVATLNRIEPYDWRSFLRTRLDTAGGMAPLDGIRRGGYRLVYTSTQSEITKDAESRARNTSLTYSIGATVDSAGKFTAVQWDGPVFRAGLAAGATLVAVNGIAFDGERLKAAVKATAEGKPLDLLVRQADVFRTVRIDYAGGLRYPQLERIEGAPALLDEILAPR